MALEENTNNEQQNAQDLFTRSKLSPEPISINAQTMAGTPKTGVNPKPAGMSYVDQKVARLNGMMLDLYKPDENKYNRLTTYNSSHYGHNFERYYSHGKFKQLGFSPFRNNEEFYNSNSSLWNDAARGGRAAMRLAGLGFASTFTNWGSFLSDKPNTEEAEEMERLMSIGSSSREGFGAKVINFGVNAGYTYGVMSEILAEELALIGATALTGGGAGGVAAVRTGVNIGRAFKALKMLTKVDDARQAWRLAKTAGSGLKNFLPLSQTTSLLTKTGRAAAKWDSLDNMAKVTKSFGAFYRDLREINAVTSEAKLEGGMVQNNVTNELMAQFRKDNGREPTLAEAQGIAGQASKAGYLASQTNMAGIYVSNKIVLDRALKGLPGLHNLERAATRSKAAFIFNKNWKELAKDPYSMVRGARKLITPGYYKQVFNPKNLGKGGLNYLSANLMEGTQEVYQEAVAKGITDYFVSTYNNPNLAGSGYFRTMMESGLKAQNSEQGLETFLSGFLMAGPISMTQSAFYKGYDAVRMKKLKNQAQKFSADPANAGKENPYQAQIDRELEFDQKTLEAMNEVTKDPTKYFSALEKDLKIQRDLALAGEQAALDGDVKFARDTRDASLISHSIQLLNAGRFDVFQDQLKGLRGLSKEELQEAFGEDPSAETGTVQERLEKVLARTNEIKNAYEEYQNTVNPYSLKTQPEDYLGFEQMRNVMISNDIHFKFVANRMTNIYDEFANTLPFENANMMDFAPLFSIGVPSSEAPILRPGMRSEIEMLTKEIEGLGDRPENAAKKEQLTKKRDSLKSLSGLSQSFLSQYLNTQKVSQNEEAFIDNSKALETTEGLFKDSFFEHIKLLAEQNGQVILDKDIEKTYQLYRDYWKLSGDKAEYANAINAFANPQTFGQMRQRMTNAMKAAMAVRKEKLKDSLATYKKKYLTNNFLNDLFEKFNAFVDPDEAQAFLDDKEIPTTFYNADTLEEIELGSEQYKEIMALVDEYDEAYFEETGKHYMKKAEGSPQSFRDKLESDKRTLNDISKEFAFDPTSQTTQVDARQVLQAVINSKFADKDLKKLAQILSGMVPAGTQVTFKMDHHTNSTYDEKNGIIVDPRFSAEGYNIGVVPIEFSIMNAMMQKIVSESLQTDATFNDAITSLRAKLAADVKDPVEKRLLSLALASNEGFVAEVMTSPLLQQKLESLPFTDNLTEQTEDAKNLWDSFISEIKNLLKRLFGNKRAASVYDEAVVVITNKLSQPGVAPSIVAEEETEIDNEVVTEEDPALEELLKKGFEQALSELDPNERLGMRYESWKLTSPLAADIIKKYQAEKVKQTVAKQETASAPALTEEERKRIITDLGYTVAEMNGMGEAEIEEIIKEKRKKKITLKRKSGDVEIDFDEFIPAEAVVENAIKNVRLKLEKANFKVFETKDAKGKVIDSWYARADKDGNEIPGTRHERVSNVVKEKGDFAEGAADRGTVIDELLRDYLNNEITNIVDFKTQYNSLRQKFPSAIFSDAMLNELFDRFRTVQRQVKSLGLRVDARMPALYGTLGPKLGTTENPVDVAGSIDVLAFNSLGEVFIIDLKTSTQDRRLQYKAEEELEKMFGAEWPTVKDTINKSKNDIDTVIDGKRVSPAQLEKLKEFRSNPEFAELDGKYGFKVYFYKSEDEAQQNAYRELLKQVSGIEVKGIVIFPLKVTKVGKTFTSVNFQMNTEGKYTMYVKGPNSMDIYDITGRENVIGEYPENPISEEKINELTAPEASQSSNNVESFSQDEFAYWLQEQIKSGNLTLTQKQVYDLLTVRPELREARLNESDVDFAKRFVRNSNYKDQIDRLDNNKTIKGTANPAWLGVTINDPTNKETDGRHKGYVTMAAYSTDMFAKDVEANIIELWNILKDAGYNGHLKIPSSKNGLNLRFDNIVIHGATKEDVALALPIIQNFLESKGLTVEGTKTGIDKKNTSHTDLLADDVLAGNVKPGKKTTKTVTPETTTEPAPAAPKVAPVDPKQQATLFRIFEKAFYEGASPTGGIKRLDDITDAQLAQLTPETRKYLVELSDYLKQFDTGFNYSSLKTDDAKIKHVSSRFFGGAGRGGMLGQPGRLEFPEMVLPVPSNAVLANIATSFSASLTQEELNAGTAEAVTPTPTATEEQPTEKTSIPKLGNTRLEELTALKRGDTLNFIQTDVTKRLTELINGGLQTNEEKEEFYNILKPLKGKYLRIGNKIGRVSVDEIRYNSKDKNAHITFENVQNMYKDGAMVNNVGVTFSGSEWHFTHVKSEYLGNPVEITNASQNEVIEAVHPAYNYKAVAEIESRYPISTDEKIADIKIQIAGLEDLIQTKYRFMNDTDSNAAVVQAEKDIAKYEEKLKKLKEELAALEGTPTEEQPTSAPSDIEAKKADIERRRMVDIKEYYKQDFSGKTKSIQQLEKELLDLNAKYDAELAALEGTTTEEQTTQSTTGTQTQMEFEELTFNVGDRVKVNTPKDGEGIIEEDLGDKVKLEDGRRIMKKNLTKLTESDNQAPTSIVTPELQGKVIYVTPSTESTTKLSDIPGVIYGNSLYASVAIGEFDDDLINKLRDIANDPAAPWDIQQHAKTIVNAFDNGITPSQIKDINSAITNLSKPGKISGTLPAIIKSIQNGILDKVIAKARELANAGATVIFDNNAVAASDKVDIAFVSPTTDLVSVYGKASYYRDAIKGISKNKIIRKPLGKSIVDIITGVVTPDIQISDAFNNLIASIETAAKNKLNAIATEIESLKRLDIYDAILQDVGLTSAQVEEALSKRKDQLQNTLDISDLSVNDVVMYKKQADSEVTPGMVIKKDDTAVTIAPISLNEEGNTNESLSDLFSRSEVSTFTEEQVPDFIFPMAKEEAPVTPDPDVKAQSDAAQEEVKSTPAEVAQRLKDNMEKNKDQSVEDVVNDVLDGLCTKKSKKQ